MKRRAALVALAFALPARAEDAPRFVVDVYDMIGGCPDEAAFRAEVERRVHARTKAPMHVAVHVVQQPRSIDGTVDVSEANGAHSTRRVTSTRCAEIVSAAALVVALAIDDAAESAPAPAPAPTAPPGEVTPNVAPLTVDTSSQERERASEGPRESDTVFRAGLQGAVQTGVSPKAVLSLPIFVELGDERRFPGFHFEPRARLAWTFAFSSDGEVPAASPTAGTATFTWMGGALDLCPLRLALGTRGTIPFLDLRACGRFELGRLAAEGHGTESTPRSENRLWVGAGAPFTLRYAPRGLPAGLFFEGEAGPRFALIRDRFTVGPPGNILESFIFRPPAVSFSGGLGAGVSFR